MAAADSDSTYSLHNLYGRINSLKTSSIPMSPSPAARLQVVEERFDAETVLNEQKLLLESSPAAEIRASPFLRFRLNAQQKLIMQRNQYVERRVQGEALGGSLHSTTTPASAPREQQTPFVEPQGTAQEHSQGACVVEQLRCSGCFHRFADVVELNKHKLLCRESFALPSAADVQSVLSVREHLDDSQLAMDALVTRSAQPSARNHPPAHGLFHGSEGGNAAAGPMFSPKTGSRSLTHPLPSPSSLREEVYAEFEARDARHEGRGHPYSREVTPPSPLCGGHRRTASLKVTSIDEMPASVVARQSVDPAGSMAPVGYQLGERFGADISVDRSSCVLAPFQSMMSYSHLGGGVDSLRESSEVPEEPLKPCPTCGRQFFAYSRWPRHVAVCDKKRRQVGSKGRTAPTPTPSTRSSTVNNSRLVPSAVDKSVESSGSITPVTKLIRSNTFGGRESVGTATVDRSAKRVPLSVTNRGSEALGMSNLTRMSSYSNASFMDEDSHAAAERVLCPSCGRRFASHVAERHIPHCLERSGGNPPIRL